MSYKEVLNKGLKRAYEFTIASADFNTKLESKIEEVKKSIKLRNLRDKNRKHSPLLKHRDAIEIDTSKLNKQAMLTKMSKHVDKVIKKKYGN